MSPAPVTDRVPVAPLREAFEASGLSLSEVARRLDWTATHPNARYPSGRRCPDVTRLKRALGMAPESHSGRYVNRTISYDLAARIAEAIGADPWAVGL